MKKEIYKFPIIYLKFGFIETILGLAFAQLPLILDQEPERKPQQSRFTFSRYIKAKLRRAKDLSKLHGSGTPLASAQ